MKHHLRNLAVPVFAMGLLAMSGMNGCKSNTEDQRRPFIFTLATTFDNAVVRIPVIDEENSKVLYDIDCNGDGEYETKSITGSIECVFPKKGKHQISMRGEIPHLSLGMIQAYCEGESCAKACEASCREDCEIVTQPFRILDRAEDPFKVCDIKRWTANKDGYCQASCTKAPKDLDDKNRWRYGRHILSIDQWGDNAWKSMRGFAASCEQIRIKAEYKPNLSQVEDMTGMFLRAYAMNDPVGDWDVSHVKTMNGVFSDCESFNQPLNSWDVSHVTEMYGMFEYCSSFNQPLDKWNVSNVEIMTALFRGANLFNQPLNSWDVSHVTVMGVMFDKAVNFNQPLENWNVSNVMNMTAMFQGAKKFNQPLEKWNVSKVQLMGWMFNGTDRFNQPLDKWDVSNVTNMNYMFGRSKKFKEPLNNY